MNEFIDMHDIGGQMIQSGFQSPIMEMEKLTLTYEKVIDLMRDLKGIGAQSVDNRSKSLTGKTKFKKIRKRPPKSSYSLVLLLGYSCLLLQVFNRLEFNTQQLERQAL